MGLILKTPRIADIIWVVSDPHHNTSILIPTKITLKKIDYMHKNVPEFNSHTYHCTYIFEEDIEMSVYNTGLKTGHKFIKEFYIGNTSLEIIRIMYRVAYPEKIGLSRNEHFDYDWYRAYLHLLEETNPELFI
jgi:hypothetical protein